MRPPSPSLTVDAIILFNGQLVLIRRKNPPYQGCYALPGGFVEIGETVEQAVAREVQEETNLQIKIIKLVGVYSEPSRDPRGHTISVAFLAEGYGVPIGGDDAACVELFDINNLPELAFDHADMIKAALNQ